MIDPWPEKSKEYMSYKVSTIWIMKPQYYKLHFVKGAMPKSEVMWLMYYLLKISFEWFITIFVLTILIDDYSLKDLML